MAEYYKMAGKVINNHTVEALFDQTGEIHNNQIEMNGVGVTSSPGFSRVKGNLVLSNGLGTTLFTIGDYGYVQVFLAVEKTGLPIGGWLAVEGTNGTHRIPVGFEGTWNTVQSEVYQIWAPVEPGSEIRFIAEGASELNFECFYRLHNSAYSDEFNSNETTGVSKFLDYVIGDNTLEVYNEEKEQWENFSTTNPYALQTGVETYRKVGVVAIGSFESYTFNQDGFAEIHCVATGALEITAELRIVIEDENGNNIESWITSKQHYFASPQYYTTSGMIACYVKKGYKAKVQIIGATGGEIVWQLFNYPTYKDYNESEDENPLHSLRDKLFRLNGQVVENPIFEKIVVDEETGDSYNDDFSSKNQRNIHSRPIVCWDENPMLVADASETWTMPCDGMLYAITTANTLMEVESNIKLTIRDQNGIEVWGNVGRLEITGLRPDYTSISTSTTQEVKEGWTLHMECFGGGAAGHIGTYWKLDPTYILYDRDGNQIEDLAEIPDIIV